MDSQEEKTEGTKLKLKSKAYTPKHPTTLVPQTEIPNQAQAEFDSNQFNDPNQLYLQYVNSYLNMGYTTNLAEQWAKYYIAQHNNENPEGAQMYYPDNYGGDPYEEGGNYGNQYDEGGQYPEENYPQKYDQAQQDNDFEDFDTSEFGEKTKKPKGKKKKDKYQGQHNCQYDESEEGYYDELNFYYNADGSFYDPDGYYFDVEGYDKYGGYYDDNANYISPDGVDPYVREFKGKENHSYEVDHEGEDEPEDKYNEQYIQYITESKYYEDLEYLKKTKHEWAYLKIGNLAEGTEKTSLLKYFGNQNIDTHQITIMMTGSKENPVGLMEIYKIPVAIQVLKECGNELNNKRVIIEVDHNNERAYNGADEVLSKFEHEDEEDSRYTKFDPKYEEVPEEVLDESSKKEEAK